MDDISSMYSPLREREFRVLLLKGQDGGLVQCELLPLNLDTTLAYTSLSYTWGEAEHTDSIIMHGTRVKVRRNLAKALERLLKLGHFVVWVDFLCINQNDISERNSQVARMRGIYEKAREVIIFLESISDRTSLPFTVCKYFCQDDVPTTFFNQERKIQEFNQDLESRAFLQDIVSSDYWGRAWIIQEVALGSQVKVLVGEQKIDWSRFEALIDFLWSPGTSFHNTHASEFCAAFQGTNELQFGINRLLVLNHLRRQKGQTLLTVLNLSEGTKQRDPRDTIYSKLGLASDSSEIVRELDYGKAPRAIFVDLVLCYIHVKKTLDIICSVVRENLNEQNLPDMRLPSWVPDWRIGESIASIFGLFPTNSTDLLFRAGAETDAALHISHEGEKEVLTVTGFTFDSVQSPDNDHVELQTGDSSEADPLQTMVAFCRTISANHFYIGDGMQVERLPDRELMQFIVLLKTYYQLGHVGRWRIGDMQLTDFEICNDLTRILDVWGSLRISGRSVSTWAMRYETTSVEKDGESLIRLITSITRVMAGRKVVEGKLGRIYLVPETTTAADRICVLSGCAMPMVLRECQGLYNYSAVVGPCYADGIMHGEAMREYLRRSTPIEFRLI